MPRASGRFPLRGTPHAATSPPRIPRKTTHASIQTAVRRNARHLLRARHLQARRRVLPRQVRRHACAVHGEPGGKGAGLDAQFRQGLGDRRIRHAAALHRRAHAPRGVVRQAGRPHAGDPAPDRPQPARRWSTCRRSANSRSRSIATSSRPMAAPAPPRSPAAGSRCTTACLDGSAADDQGLEGAARTMSPRFPAASSRASRSSTSTISRIRRPAPTPISS